MDANSVHFICLQMTRPSSKAIVPTSKSIDIPPITPVTRYHPIDTINRYQVLGNIPKHSYTSVLASDLFTSSSQCLTPYTPNLVKSVRSDYVKFQSTNLYFKEPIHKNTHNVLDLVKSYFPSG